MIFEKKSEYIEEFKILCPYLEKKLLDEQLIDHPCQFSIIYHRTAHEARQSLNKYWVTMTDYHEVRCHPFYVRALAPKSDPWTRATIFINRKSKSITDIHRPEKTIDKLFAKVVQQYKDELEPLVLDPKKRPSQRSEYLNELVSRLKKIDFVNPVTSELLSSAFQEKCNYVEKDLKEIYNSEDLKNRKSNTENPQFLEWCEGILLEALLVVDEENFKDLAYGNYFFVDGSANTDSPTELLVIGLMGQSGSNAENVQNSISKIFRNSIEDAMQASRGSYSLRLLTNLKPLFENGQVNRVDPQDRALQIMQELICKVSPHETAKESKLVKDRIAKMIQSHPTDAWQVLEKVLERIETAQPGADISAQVLLDLIRERTETD